MGCRGSGESMRYYADTTRGQKAVRAQILCAGLVAGLMVAATVGRTESLEEVLVKTYQTSPELAAERAATRATDEEITQAKSKWMPTLNAEGSYAMSSASGDSGGTQYDVRSRSWSADLVARQPLFTGGRNGATRRIAEAQVSAQRARLRSREQSVLLEAAIVYASIVRNEAVLDLVREDIAILQALLKEFTDRHDVGKATDSDVDQILASLEAARAECLAHHATLQNSWRSYEQVVGEPPMLLEPAEALGAVSPCIDALGQRKRSTLKMPEKLPMIPGTLEEVEEAARGNVPELDIARAEEAASRGTVSAAYAELLPKAGLTASIGTSGEDEDPQGSGRDSSVSARLSIPLFNGGGEWSEIRAARERANQAKLKITSAQRQIMRSAHGAWYDLVSVRAVRAVNKAKAQTVLRAFDGLRKEMMDPKLHRSITDLLGLRQAYLFTQIALIGSNREEAVTVFKLLAATGRLNASDLKLPVEPYNPDINLKRQANRFIGDTIQGE
jgi:outer membrane protein